MACERGMPHGVPLPRSIGRVVSTFNFLFSMSETIRKKQIDWIKSNLQGGATFNATLNRLSKAGDGIRCYSTDGRWFLSQSDLDQILEENGRGLIGEITPDYLRLFNPKMRE